MARTFLFTCLSLYTSGMDIQPGIYRHYKGNHYEVIGVAVHTETLEELVVYRDVSSPDKLWVRPVAMFGESVEVGGKIVPRFSREES